MKKHRTRPKKVSQIKMGSTHVSKLGLPRYSWHDIYHLTLTLSWPVFLTLICTIFLGINALFALAYLADGAIGNYLTDGIFTLPAKPFIWPTSVE